MESLTLLTLADESYAMPLAVMVRSLLDRLASDLPVRIVVIDGGIARRTRQRLEESWRDSTGWPQCRVEYTTPSFGGASDLPIWGRMKTLTYARLSAAEYLPPECEKVVLLDSDMLVLTDIVRLAATHLGDAVIAAAQDPYIPLVSSVGGLRNYAALGFEVDARYFNAGLMLIDVQRWREERIGPRAFAFLEKHRNSLQQYDQDALNAVLAGRWKELDPRWQFHPRAAHALGSAAAERPYIVHFSGLLKPWSYRARHWADAAFYEVLDRTAWRGFRPKRTFRSLALGWYDSPVRRAIHPLEKRLMAAYRHTLVNSPPEGG